MRIVGLGFLVLILLSVSMTAQAGSAFTGFFCRQRVPCDSTDPSFPDTESLVAMANACVGRNLGIPSGTGLFDSSGIDSNGCFSTVVQSIPLTAGSRLVPQCCIKPVPEGGCAISCDVSSQ